MVWPVDDLAGVLGCKLNSLPMQIFFEVVTMIFDFASSELDDWTKVTCEKLYLSKGDRIFLLQYPLEFVNLFSFFSSVLSIFNPPCSAIRAFKIIQECIVCLYCYIFLVLFLNLQHQCRLSWIISVFCCCYSKSDAVDPSNFCPN